MRRKIFYGLMGGGLLLFVAATQVGAVAELCNRVDQKPVLSIQAMTQAEFVEMLVNVAELPQPPSCSQQGMVEQCHQDRVQLLIDNGFPPGLAQVEPTRPVNRRYFVSIMYPIAVQQDPAFAQRYGGLTDETQQAQALADAEYMYSTEDSVTRQEALSVLCTKGVRITPPQAAAVVVKPVKQKDANTEVPVSAP